MKKVLKNEIITLRKQGKKYSEIRKELGCTMSVISYHCKQEGISSEMARNKPLKEEQEKMNSLYKEGKTLNEISKTLKRGRNTIRKYIIDYKFTPKERKLSVSKAVMDWRRRKKIQLVEYKGGKCEKCGYSKCMAALQFHHLNPLEKDFTIGGKSWGFSRLKEEVDKCVLVCSNCHIEIHQNIRDCS